MKTHRLKPDGFWIIRINLQKKCLQTIMAVIVFVPFFAFWFFSFNPVHTIFLVLGLVFLSLINYLHCLRVQKSGLDSYELTVSDDLIIRNQAQIPEVAIQRGQVTGIHETAGVGILVMTADYYKYIFIPAMLDNYDEVRDELKRWKAIEIMPDKRFFSKPSTTVVVFVVSFMTTVLAEDIRVFLPAGLLMVSLLVHTLIGLHIKTDVEARVRRKRFITNGLVLSVSVLVLRLLDWFR